MSKRLNDLMHFLDDAVTGLDADAVRCRSRIPAGALVRGDTVLAEGDEARLVHHVELADEEVRIHFDAGPGVVVPSELTVRVASQVA